MRIEAELAPSAADASLNRAWSVVTVVITHLPQTVHRNEATMMTMVMRTKLELSGCLTWSLMTSLREICSRQLKYVVFIDYLRMRT